MSNKAMNTVVKKILLDVHEKVESAIEAIDSDQSQAEEAMYIAARILDTARNIMNGGQ